MEKLWKGYTIFSGILSMGIGAFCTWYGIKHM